MKSTQYAVIPASSDTNILNQRRVVTLKKKHKNYHFILEMYTGSQRDKEVLMTIWYSGILVEALKRWRANIQL